eukprot:3006775-Amphidinium_carterae.1
MDAHRATRGSTLALRTTLIAVVLTPRMVLNATFTLPCGLGHCASCASQAPLHLFRLVMWTGSPSHVASIKNVGRPKLGFV